MEIEVKTVVFMSLNELAPQYVHNLFRKNSQSTSFRLRNISTGLRLPKKMENMARNSFRLDVQNCGTATQLTVSKHPP